MAQSTTSPSAFVPPYTSLLQFLPPLLAAVLSHEGLASETLPAGLVIIQLTYNSFSNSYNYYYIYMLETRFRHINHLTSLNHELID